VSAELLDRIWGEWQMMQAPLTASQRAYASYLLLSGAREGDSPATLLTLMRSVTAEAAVQHPDVCAHLVAAMDRVTA
jgi:hypothetical protein